MFKISPKTIVLGGLAIAAAAGALKNRDKVAGLIGARSSAPEPPRPEPSAPAPPVSNYDVDGPAQNTATKVPAPEPFVRDEQGGIDERAEEAAAAAEAAAIGGPAPEYPGLSLDEKADEAEVPMMEAGEGESEGEELAEFDLVDEAEPRAGETSDAERQVAETIESQEQPQVGESIEAIEVAAPDATSEDDAFNSATADAADDAPTSTAKDDDDPSNDGVKETAAEFPPPNGSGIAQRPGFGFAGGKVGTEEPVESPATGLSGLGADASAAEAEEPEESPATGLSGLGGLSADASASTVEAVDEEAPEDEGPAIHPDQTSLLDDDAGEDAPKEKSAAEKSSAVWEPPKSADPSSEDDDEGGSEWQTWSGRAIRP